MKELPIHPSQREDSSAPPLLRRNGREWLRLGDKSSGPEKGQDLWLLTLSDLLLLLLIFFVLLFGMTLQPQPQAAHSPEPQVAAATRSEDTPFEVRSAQAAEAASEEMLASFEADLKAILNTEEGKEVIVGRTADRLVLTFPERIVFDPGQAQLKPSVQLLLDKIASFALTHPYSLLEVQGHTDDRPINTRRYPSNWELSVDRATQVAKALIGLGLDPAQITVKAFGEYRTLYPNDSDSHRQENRRVEIQFFLTPRS